MNVSAMGRSRHSDASQGAIVQPPVQLAEAPPSSHCSPGSTAPLPQHGTSDSGGHWPWAGAGYGRVRVPNVSTRVRAHDWRAKRSVGMRRLDPPWTGTADKIA
jgi:hypothetical protein